MSCPKFIAESFAVRTAAHLQHLCSQSYSQHIALGEFYTQLADLIDTYTEVYMGLEGRIKAFPDATPPNDNPVTLLNDYLKLVQDEQGEDRDSEALKNTLAEIEGLTARTLYRIQNLR